MKKGAISKIEKGKTKEERKATKEEKYEYQKELYAVIGRDLTKYFSDKYGEMEVTPRGNYNASLKIEAFVLIGNGEKDDQVLVKKGLGSINTIKGYRREFNLRKKNGTL